MTRAATAALGPAAAAMVVREALDCPEETLREVVRRCFIADASSRALGEGLRLPPGTEASRISRGRVLRRALQAPPVAGGDSGA